MRARAPFHVGAVGDEAEAPSLSLSLPQAIRTYLAKKKAGEIVAAQEAANREAMALRIQAWTRGWLDRMKVKKKWEEVLGPRG